MRILVIGYGNPSRQDDGVGLAVVNGLRARAGQAPLDEGDDGFDDLGHDLDTLFLQQLSPELAETLAEYDHVALVDAHFGIYPELVHRTELDPQVEAAIVSHHFKPGTLLALAHQLYGRAPTAELISVRGFAFDFTSELSPQTAAGVAQVIEDLASRFGGKTPTTP
ncbi:MAG: hydrogenase maturation protease [Bacteroidota bacterium]